MSGLDQLFRVADEVGVDVFGIGMRHKLLGNEHFPWPKISLFTPPDSRVGDWPSAWTLAKRAGIWDSCGNTGQACIRRDGLPTGVWVRALDGWAQVA